MSPVICWQSWHSTELEQTLFLTSLNVSPTIWRKWLKGLLVKGNGIWCEHKTGLVKLYNHASSYSPVCPGFYSTIVMPSHVPTTDFIQGHFMHCTHNTNVGPFIQPHSRYENCTERLIWHSKQQEQRFGKQKAPLPRKRQRVRRAYLVKLIKFLRREFSDS